jgi:hypothetical protein
MQRFVKKSTASRLTNDNTAYEGNAAERIFYMHRTGPSIGGIIYILIGIIVAANRGYFGAIDSVSALLNLLLAVFLWPLLLFGVSFNLSLGI